MPGLEALHDRLSLAADKGRKVRLWLRDDDATEATPALERLLGLLAAHDAPALIAAIPGALDPSLPDRLSDAPRTRVAVHGWSHANHAPPGAKKTELGVDRPVEAVIAELRRGREHLQGAFPDRFLPILVPPWNRIAPEVVAALPSAGFAALSTFGPERAAPVPLINTHVDLIDWRGHRGGRSDMDLSATIGALLDSGLSDIGVLTHHLAHDAQAWSFLERLLALADRHPAVSLCGAETLLAERGGTSGSGSGTG